MDVTAEKARLLTLSNEALVDEYARGFARFHQSVADATDAQRRAHPVAGKWSLHELLCHLVDFEIINADRIKRVIAEDVPPIRDTDEGPFAARLFYEARSFEGEIAVFKAIRAHVAVVLRHVSPGDWNRLGDHSIDGRIPLRKFVERATRHVIHHAPFVHEKRVALGLPTK